MKNVAPQTPVRSLIRFRPMAIGLLEKRKIRFWDELDRTLDELIPRELMGDFLEEVAYARLPAPDTDWNAMPMYFLADYLTAEHRDFLVHEISDITHILDVHTLSDADGVEGLRKLQRGFHDFVKECHLHFEEEEIYLFPKVLRYEACLRDHRVHPEFHKGSVQSHLASRSTQDGKRALHSLSVLTGWAQEHAKAHAGSVAARDLLDLLTRFLARFQAHVKLEAEVLFPVATELERNLYNLSIDGDPAVAFHRRGPMDSGILRLEDL